MNPSLCRPCVRGWSVGRVTNLGKRTTKWYVSSHRTWQGCIGFVVLAKLQYGYKALLYYKRYGSEITHTLTCCHNLFHRTCTVYIYTWVIDNFRNNKFIFSMMKYNFWNKFNIFQNERQFLKQVHFVMFSFFVLIIICSMFFYMIHLICECLIFLYFNNNQYSLNM